MIESSETYKRRMRDEAGLTLVELLAVMLILGVLTAVGVSSYLGFRDRGNNTAAAADVRAIVPAIETYFSDHSTYAGMTIAGLKSSYDQSIDLSRFTLGSATASSYCVQATSGDKTYMRNGPGATIVAGSCA